MRNFCKDWNAICTNLCPENPPLSVKMAPKLRDFGAKNEQLSGYYGQNTASALTELAAKLFQSIYQLITKVYATWEGNSIYVCYPMTPVSV